jgi:hypothetical protein
MFLDYFQYLPYEPGDENLVLEDMMTLSVGREEPVEPVTSFLAYPNPFEESVGVQFRLRDKGVTKLSVYDAQGRKLATLADRFFTPGTHRIEWNGQDESGQVAGNGLYLIVLETGDVREVRKLVRMQ